MSISSVSDTFSSMKPPVSLMAARREPVCGAVDGVAGFAGVGWLRCGLGGGEIFCCAGATHTAHHSASMAAAKTLLDLTIYSLSAARPAVPFFRWRSQMLCSLSFSSVFLRTQMRFPKGVASEKRMESPCSTAVVRWAGSLRLSIALCLPSAESAGHRDTPKGDRRYVQTLPSLSVQR